jgi:exonuclease III
MVNVFNWNCRDFNKSKKKLLLTEYLHQHKADLIDIQETKIESVSERILTKLSSTITCWVIKPSQGNSGGILVGINDSLYQVLDQWILDYSITICLKNKANSFI